jgi:hypothetical protein
MQNFKSEILYRAKYLPGNSRLFILCFFFMMKIQVSGQIDSGKRARDWFLSVDVMLNRTALIDKKFSSVPFSGTSPAISSSIKCEGPTAEHEITILYIFNSKLKTNTSLQSKPEQTGVNLDYINLYPLYKSGNHQLKCKAGGGIQFLHTERVFKDYINNNRSFEIAVSAGAIIQAEYNLPDKFKGFYLINRITIPFLFFYSQPAYSGNDEELNNRSALNIFFKKNNFAAIPQLLRFKNSFAIEKKIDDRRFVAVTYNWDYYNIRTLRKVLISGHQAGVLFRYKL